MFIIENDIPANRGKGRICLAVIYLEFDNFSYVMYIFTCHGRRHDARPERIPVVCFEIVCLFDYESLVVTPLKTLANSLDSDLIRPEILIRFQTA